MLFDANHQQARRHDAFLAEAADAGVEVGEMQTHELRTGTKTEAVGQLFKLATLGEIKARPTHLQIYALRGAFGPFLYARPFEGGDDLVGEFHVLLRGGLPQPIVLVPRFFKTAWATNDDAALAARLKAHAHLAAAVAQLEWAQHGTRGKTRLEWGVQVSTISRETSHLVMQSASYGHAPRRVGLREMVAIATAIQSLLEPGQPIVGGFYMPPAFDKLFYEVYPTFADLARQDQ